MNFDGAVELIIGVEKGFVDNPNDPGGATNFGISQRAYPDLNIKTLTRDQAIELYRRDFWQKYFIELLPEILRLIFFDSCVNQGPHFSIQTLQHILGVPQDGLLGPATMAKLSNFTDLDLLEAFATRRLEHYFENKEFSEFGVGWIRRLLEITLKTTR